MASSSANTAAPAVAPPPPSPPVPPQVTPATATAVPTPTKTTPPAASATPPRRDTSPFSKAATSQSSRSAKKILPGPPAPAPAAPDPPPPPPLGPPPPPDVLVSRRKKGLWRRFLDYRREKGLRRRYLDYRYFDGEDDGRINKFPGLATVMRMRALDYLVVLGGILTAWFINRYVPPRKDANFTLFDQSLSHKLQPSPVSFVLDTVYTVAIPLLVLSLVSLLTVHSFWDLHNALLGFAFAQAGAALFQLVIKKCFGSLRPHFYDLCKPAKRHVTHDLKRIFGSSHVKLPWRFMTFHKASDVCTKIVPWYAFESFPSGHAVAAFTACIYLSIYLRGKIKSRSSNPLLGLKVVTVFVPVLLAVILANAMVGAGWHHPRDVIVGGIIGAAFAFAGYKMMFESINDTRRNHRPLVKLPSDRSAVSDPTESNLVRSRRRNDSESTIRPPVPDFQRDQEEGQELQRRHSNPPVLPPINAGRNSERMV